MTAGLPSTDTAAAIQAGDLALEGAMEEQDEIRTLLAVRPAGQSSGQLAGLIGPKVDPFDMVRTSAEVF